MVTKWKLSLTVSFLLVIFIFGGALAAQAAAVSQSTVVFAAGDATAIIPGSSATLVRNNSGVTATLKTSGLEPGAAYTMWWVIFNHPEFCIDGCNGPDLFIPEVEAGVLFAAGHVISNNGKGNFAARLKENTLPNGPGQIPFVTSGVDNPLFDSMTAEVHLVVRNHREVIPELLPGMINSFGGGCTPETDPSGEGPEGPNECFDAQAAVFVAP